jgi:tRNA threonylcarbamoyladenosine biosynthesis protein TsaB
MGLILRFLALETSTQHMSVGLRVNTAGHTQGQWLHEAAGGAQASHTLLPTLQHLLQQAALSLDELDALVLGHGPGAFTGLRTACAVAQGLAYGVRSAAHPRGLPVLGVDTLLAVAEEARYEWLKTKNSQGERLWITAVLDARMGEVYVASYRFDHAAVAQAVCVAGPDLCTPTRLADARPTVPLEDTHLWAGNVWADLTLMAGIGERIKATNCLQAWPTAAALLRLAPALWHSGQAVSAAEVQPLYVRNKVAQTTAERAAVVTGG